MKPSSVFVFAISSTLRASKSFGLTRLRALDSLIARVCVNGSSEGGGDAMLRREEDNESAQVGVRR